MRKTLKLILVLTIAMAAPLMAFKQDLGTDGGSGGAGGTCARQCRDGSWSGIACLSGQTAYCTCSGSSVQANPYCL